MKQLKISIAECPGTLKIPATLPRKMATNIVWLTGNYHFGNNPGVFQDATYIGDDLHLPLKDVWFDDKRESVSIFFYTHDVETWESGTPWQGHQVTINGEEVGRIIDRDDASGVYEKTEVNIPVARLLAIMAGKKAFTLGIVLERQKAEEQFADDFVLVRIEGDAGFSARLGG